VTDTDANLSAMAKFLQGRKNIQRVELLPYNRAAGGKYAPLGMTYHPLFDESQPVRPNLAVFEPFDIRVIVA
jgi:hypothetical protein